MAKDSVSDWDATAGNNTDVASVNIGEGMAPSGVNNAMRAMMAQVASYTRAGADLATAGTLNLDSIDTLWLDLTGTTTVTAVTLTTGHVRFCRTASAFQMTAGASLIVNGSTSINYVAQAGDLLMFRGYATSVVRVWVLGKRKRTVQSFTSGTTWTKPAGCIAVVVEAVGGGGGGGGAGGATNPGAIGGGGGGSGAYGFSDFINVTGIATTATIAIGAAGAAGANTGGDGGVGGNTTFNDGSTTYTWGGGSGGQGGAKITGGMIRHGGTGGSGTNVNVNGPNGHSGHSDATPDLAYGGAGGTNPFGRGGGYRQSAAGNATAGVAVNGYGGGGGGASACDTASTAAGAAGGAGFMRVWEYY